MIRLRYLVNLSYEIVDRTADFLFLVEAARTARQSVVEEELRLTPAIPVTQYTYPDSCNRMLRVQSKRGRLAVRYEAVVEIDHRLDEWKSLHEVPVADLPFDVLPHLAPSRYCESDRMMEFALREFGGMQRGYARVYAIREWARQHMRYLSHSTNERTSAIDTLVERTGVCRDFAHLMIAVCRALSIPARISSSLDYGADPAMGPTDFHAIVEVYLSGGWYLLDPSGVSIPTGLLRIGTGRDAADIPFAAIFGNVRSERPYIEVEALTDPAAGIEMPLATLKAISTW
ncbi:transglutaminase-like domain-containing protein [Cupriavidus agavae]|uniref:Transglutaminase-like putative cysteine protease n=1 Tax=Cupriavidus agavae TaxID=1001822 RepID=A0A4Q7R988_9BURK|nr:transglutaminase family protein [Cupriavidus agavae]RZT28867.1 transglutaminase-like putative cysteine protease [Cupriavidus agavae]